MRGAARIGGRAFKVPKSQNPLEQFNPLEALDLIGDLPVAPRLEPINDEWSWSIGAEPADPRDCARYPASPYCGDLPLTLTPIGYEVEVKTNGCETCVYVYPVILFLKLTPQVICHRDPNCKADTPAPPINQSLINRIRPPQYPENVEPNEYKSPQCAERESIINRWHNRRNAAVMAAIEGFKSLPSGLWRNKEFIDFGQISNPRGLISYLPPPAECQDDLSNPFSDTDREPWVYMTRDDFSYRNFVLLKAETRTTTSDPWYEVSSLQAFLGWRVGKCCGMPSPPPILPPPPLPLLPEGGQGEQGQRGKRGKRGKDMCCNDCADSKDNTEKLLREIKEVKKALGSGKLEKALNAAVGIGDESITAIVNLIAKRLGTSSYPIEVPESLLQGVGDRSQKIQSNAEFLHWLTYQFDGLVGQFPIDVEIKDIDPLKEGDQNKTIQLPNLAEAIAEIYGLTIKNSVNQEVELNMLLRLAAEAIATKNAAVVTQDYARANAQFLGYKANFKPRELQYNFDFTNANLDPRSKEPIVLEKLLRTVKGYVQGWQLEDKETVVGFLQKLMFSAGIIKAVFFRGKGQQKELQREINSMANDEKAQEAKFDAFIKEINDPNSRFNRDSTDKPEIKDETPPDSNRGTR